MSKKASSLIGRPSTFKAETAAIICERIANGESLRSICADSSMPCTSTVCRWLAASEDFQRAMSCAREMQADTLAEEILEIADNEAEDPQSRRVRVDARKWYASKLRPQKYGDRIEHGIDGNAEMKIRVVIGGNGGVRDAEQSHRD